MMSLAYRRAHATEAVVARAHHRVEPKLENLTTAIRRAREALMAQQNESGYWCYEFEADCTIPAEYILMMHFVNEVDEGLEAKIAGERPHRRWKLWSWENAVRWTR